MDNVYEYFGRHTEAGHKLYWLYNRKPKPYEPCVRIKTKPSNPQREHEEKLRKEREAVRQRVHKKVKVPRPYRKKGAPAAPFRPQKKTADEILRELRRNESRQLEEARKRKKHATRVRKLKMKKEEEENEKRARELEILQRKKRQREKDLFDTIMEEIEERERFLNEMRALGLEGECQEKITREINVRVKELRRLQGELP